MSNLRANPDSDFGKYRAAERRGENCEFKFFDNESSAKSRAANSQDFNDDHSVQSSSSSKI